MPIDSEHMPKQRCRYILDDYLILLFLKDVKNKLF